MNEAILQFTDQAVEHINKSLVRFPDGGFRVSVKKAGCSGWKYVPEVVAAPKENDVQFTTEQGLRVFVDPGCVSMIRGTRVKLEMKTLGQKLLTFDNPNITGECGCGESFHLAEDDHG